MMSGTAIRGVTLVCPSCHGSLHDLRCASCNRTFESHNGIPILLSTYTLLQEQYSGEHAFKNFFKRWPFLYKILFAVVGPALLTGLTSKKFIQRFPHNARILHAGSGTRRLGEHCINVDLFPMEGVDVAADLHALPFSDGLFDAVTSEQVLEHVPSPHAVARELLRVTRSGGLIHIAIPFLFPWHPSPSDFTRWTYEGIADLFPECSVEERGISAGPCSAFVAFMSAFLATILSFGSRTLQLVWQYVFLVALSPVKLLDFLFAHFQNSQLCAAELYVVLRKK